jgi:hypothetical protein
MSFVAQPITRSQTNAAGRWAQKIEVTGNLVATGWCQAMGIPMTTVSGSRLNTVRDSVDFEINSEAGIRTVFIPVTYLHNPPFNVDWPVVEVTEEEESDDDSDE